MGKFKLIEEIIARSESDIWEEARVEWDLLEVYEADEEPETCLCGHFPILECCVLRNSKNGNTTTVGNVCVKKFIGLPSDRIFQAVKRVRKEGERSLNAEAITHAHSKRWINTWERDFYLDIMRKRKLTAKQRTKKREINEKMLQNMRR